MAKLSTAKIVGMLSSAKKTGRQVLNAAGEWVAEIVEDFVSGFAGHGWKIWEYVKGKWKLEIDAIVVRGTMTIFELLIQKIRAVKGALGITQACGKIKTAELDADGMNWLITIEDEMSFVAHDFIRCQDWQGGNLKGYWVEISEVRQVDGVDTIVVPVSEFMGGIGYTDGMEAVKPELTGMATPAVGDEIVQFGNSVNENRQSAIYLHADEGGQPAIDILFGIKSKSFAGCVKQRMGGDIPGTDGLKGFYCENGMIKGTDESGHTVYCIYPDGSAEFGDGSAKFNTDRSGKLAGGAISWKWDSAKGKYICTMGDVILSWDNLGDDVKENLRVTGIQGADVEYAQSTSSTVAPTTGWQTDAPAWENGKYIWSRTKITLTDGTVNYTKPACISGGKGIASIVEQYYLSSSSSSLSGGSWSTDRPTWKNGWYIWTRSVITYTDGTSTTTEAICVTGEKGEDGADGPQGVPGEPGADGKVYYTWIRYANDAQGSGISNDPTGKTFIGLAYNKETSVESNTPSDYSWSRFRGFDGSDGADGRDGTDGVPGPPGADGKTTYTWIAYSDNANGSGMYQIPKDSTKYIGIAVNKDTATESTNPADYTWSQFKGDKGDKGDQGDKGEPGLPGSDANVPDWVKEWDTGKVQIGDKYMISPMLFTGKNTGTVNAPMLTGILQGEKCITIDGVERSGIYAIVNNEVVFELDPINRKNTFKGNVVADSGNIGGFSIGPGSLESTLGSDGMLLSASLVRFTGDYSSIFIGAETMPAIGGGSFSTPVRIAVDRVITSKLYGNAGLHISIEGAQAYDDTDYQFTGNHAIYIPKGNICGFRLRLRRIGASTTLSVMDSTIIAITTGITLTVPSTAEDGQFFWIRNSAGGDITIAGTNLVGWNSGETSTSIVLRKSNATAMYYDAINNKWFMNWIDCWN